MSIKEVLLTLAAVACLAPPVAAGVSAASVFSDHMVLQRGENTPVWGEAEPGAEVEVALGRQSARGKADERGRWVVRFKSLRADAKPQTLTVACGDDRVTFQDVLVGDVWLCSGQSNMQMTLGDSAGGGAFAEKHGNNPRVRLLAVPKTFSDKVQAKQGGKWSVNSPKGAEGFSAVGYTTAVFLSESPELKGVPIGVVDSSFGATVVEGWIPAESLAAFDAKDVGPSMFGGPTQHYNAMVAPLLPMGIKGVVWYQGEGNSGRPATYGPFLQAMVASWRKGFERPELPFVIVQLPAFREKGGDLFFSWLREQQDLVARREAGVGLAVTYDTHDGSDLHPPEKIPVGLRVALVARGMVYKGKTVATGPVFDSAEARGETLRVRFDVSGGALATADGSDVVRGFMVAGEDGEYRHATGKLEGDDTVVLAAPGMASPRTVRFAWAGVPDANLVNKRRLPAAPFRTDDETPRDIALVKVPAMRTVKTPEYEAVFNGSGSLVSLGVGGQQFISNDLGMKGGTNIPAWLGPHTLNQVREIGPSRIAFSDSVLTLKAAFEPGAIRLTLENRSNQPVTFRVSLSPEVRVVQANGLELSRGGAGVVATGFDGFEQPSEQGATLLKQVPAGGSGEMAIEVRGGR